MKITANTKCIAALRAQVAAPAHDRSTMHITATRMYRTTAMPAAGPVDDPQGLGVGRTRRTQQVQHRDEGQRPRTPGTGSRPEP